MKLEKYTAEVKTLKTYFEYYCKANHTNQKDKEICHTYKDANFNDTISLCDQCLEAMKYSIERLQNCPYEEKPRCRTCKTPCYQKSYWKRVAKVMIYSSVRLTLTHIKDKYFF
jgi:hypothetical protein